ERGAAFARGGNDPMLPKQAAGPMRAGQTGKQQNAAPGAKAAKADSIHAFTRSASCSGKNGTAQERSLAMANYLTQQDVQDYGTDLIDLTQRAVAHALSPQIEQLAQENHRLQHWLGVESRHRMDREVE